jgi:hypothetical protein
MPNTKDPVTVATLAAYFRLLQVLMPVELVMKVRQRLGSHLKVLG